MSEKAAPRQSFAANGRGQEISPEEAAALLAISPRAIRYLISSQKIRAKKVSGRWFALHASVLSYRDDQAVPEMAAANDQRGPRAIAPYRLFLQAARTLDFQSGQNELDRRVAELKLHILEALGAGFYSYGGEKKYQYQAARAMMGGILGLLYPYREQSPKLRQTLQFLEEDCIPSLASLSRKLDSKKQGTAQHA